MPLNLFESKEKHRIDYQGDKALFENAREEYTENSKVTLVLRAESETIYEVRKDKYEIIPVNRSTDSLIYEFQMPRRDVKIQVIKTNKKQKEILLYDYYSRVTGTAVPHPYYEIQVYQLVNGTVKAVETIDGGSRDQRTNRYDISGEIKEQRKFWKDGTSWKTMKSLTAERSTSVIWQIIRISSQV